MRSRLPRNGLPAVLIVLLAFFPTVARAQRGDPLEQFAQATPSGRIGDAATGRGLPGSQVVLAGDRVVTLAGHSTRGPRQPLQVRELPNAF
jgi:hypothetical protein